MKTFIGLDATGKFIEKMASIEACLNDGTLLGSVKFNLASFAKPDKYINKMTMQNLEKAVSGESYISVEVTTSDGSKQQNGKKPTSGRV